MYEEYLSPTSQQIHKQYTNILYNAISYLKKYGWKDGSKPQGNQLKAVMDATVALENLYENHLTPHIKVIRFLNYKCPLTSEMVSGVQTLRKKDIIPLLKNYDSSLGQPLPTFSARRVVKPSIGSLAAKIDERFGLYGRDWIWANIEGYFGKSTYFSHEQPLYYVFSATETAERGGHQYFEDRLDQEMFDELFSTYNIGKPKAKPMSAAKPSPYYTMSSGNTNTIAGNVLSVNDSANVKYVNAADLGKIYNDSVTPDQLKAKYPKTGEEVLPVNPDDIFRWSVPMPKENNDAPVEPQKPKTSADKYNAWVNELHNKAKKPKE